MGIEDVVSGSTLWRRCNEIGVADRIARAYSVAAFRYARLFENGRVTTRVGSNHAQFYVSSPLEYRRARWALGERPVIQRLLSEIEQEDVFYDVGANVGTYACLCTAVCEHVVAFEPVPENRDRLKENLSLNANADRWTVVPVALSDMHGSATMERHGELPGSGAHRFAEDGELIVDQESADSLIESEGLPTPDVVKIDVEGAELSVLEGMRETLSSVRLLYCEVHREVLTDADVDAIETLLAENGFVIDRVHDRGGTYYLRASSTEV